MVSSESTMPVETACCMHCRAAAPLTVYAYRDEGRVPLALCAACARNPARLRALIRALGLVGGINGPGAATSDV